jgi:hypothetical protein
MFDRSLGRKSQQQKQQQQIMKRPLQKGLVLVQFSFHGSQRDNAYCKSRELILINSWKSLYISNKRTVHHVEKQSS